MKASEIMHKNVKWAAPDTSLADIARLMREEDVGAIPIAEQGRLVGMVTDRDIVTRAIASGENPRDTTAKSVMTEETLWSYEDADLNEVANLMKQKRVRRIPVMDRNKALVGMISVGDITRSSEQLAGDTLRELSTVGD